MRRKQNAFELVEDLFKGKTDKGGNEYLQHLIRVTAKVKGDTPKTIALLHDVIEDTNITSDDLLLMGFSQEVVDGVCILTRANTETYNEYITRICNSDRDDVKKIKLADLEDNMNLSRIPKPTEEDINRVMKRYMPAHKKISASI